MTDTHSHLHLLPEPQEALQRASGLRAILTLGTDVASSASATRYASRFANVYAAVGLHPTEASLFDSEVAASLRELAQQPRVRASGETGIDYYWDAASREEQLRVLDFQLELANDNDLAMVFHVRSQKNRDDAERDLQSWLEANKPQRFVLHAFGGDMALAESATALGGYVSFAGNLTYKKNRRLREIAGLLPLERLLVETDSPYLPPEPMRGKKNEPLFVRYTLEALANSRGLPFEEMERISDENARRLFRW